MPIKIGGMHGDVRADHDNLNTEVEEIEQSCIRIESALARIENTQAVQGQALALILEEVLPPPATSTTFTLGEQVPIPIKTLIGELTKMPIQQGGMHGTAAAAANPQFNVGFMAPYVVGETNPADGTLDPPVAGDTCKVTSPDPTTCLVVPDATPSVPNAVQTGFLQFLKPATGFQITEEVTHADGTNFPPVTDTFDILPPAAVATTFVLGPQVPIPPAPTPAPAPRR